MLLKLRGFVQLIKIAHAQHRLLHLVQRSSSVVHRALLGARRPLGHAFRRHFHCLPRCVIFLALVDRHLREQLFSECQDCAGFVDIVTSTF